MDRDLPCGTSSFLETLGSRAGSMQSTLDQRLDVLETCGPGVGSFRSTYSAWQVNGYRDLLRSSCFQRRKECFARQPIVGFDEIQGRSRALGSKVTEAPDAR